MLSVLGACTTAPSARDQAARFEPVPAAWHAPLPHAGQTAALALWWERFDDPVLPSLVAAAQAVSPSIAAARSRIVQARAVRVGAAAAQVPKLDGQLQASRGQQDLSLPLGTLVSAGLQTSWEADLFGRVRAAFAAADERVAGAEAGWHDARVSVAAEVADAYVALRACEARLVQIELDARSRSETARLTGLSAEAGFQPPAGAALARASAAQGQVNLAQQRAQCDLDIKALVALTGLPEPDLRGALAPATAQLPQPPGLDVPVVPAEVLAQRPDVHAAAREVVASSADIDEAEAARYPRVTLAGSIGAARFDSSLGNLSGAAWTVGPVTVWVPLFDGGRRAADVVAARARYDEAVAAYAGRLRTAVREVESALVALQSTATRQSDAADAAEGFGVSYRASESLYRGGLGNLFDLESARRDAVLAQISLVELQRERAAAWIALYRALGGGWDVAGDRSDAR